MVALGIATEYAETQFRSRLEARWASFFDTIGWRWTYEPIDAEGYIPDFLIHGERPLFVEVGPCVTRRDYEKKAQKAAGNADHLRQDILILGVDWRAEIGTLGAGTMAAGWLGEYSPGYEGGDEIEARGSLTWGTGQWALCRVCRHIGVYHDHMSYALRPCGHYDGDHHIGWADESILRHAWAGATNRSQWKP